MGLVYRTCMSVSQPVQNSCPPQEPGDDFLMRHEKASSSAISQPSITAADLYGCVLVYLLVEVYVYVPRETTEEIMMMTSAWMFIIANLH